MNVNKKYWLYIEPYCFIFTEKDNALIYNTLSSSKIEVAISKKLNKIIRELKVPKNLYCVEINEKDLEDVNLRKFVNNLKANFSGDIVDASLCKVKPTIMYPELKLQGQIQTLEKMKNVATGRDILTYLNEILIQINGKCDINCSCCNNTYKQTIFCTQNSKELDIGLIEKVLNQLNGTAIQRLHITGGNIFKYSELNKLILFLDSALCQINYHLHYKNVFNNIEDISIFNNKNSLISIKVDFPIQENKIRHISNKLKSEKINHNWHFLISSRNEYEKYEEIHTTLSLVNTEIFPIFNNTNIEFFEDNVFLNKEDILLIESKRREIFSKSVLNINYFGKLTIMSDGNVYSNINNPKIGNLGQSLYELIQIELKDGNSWFNFRDSKPCTECFYQLLCPSPSNYEQIIGKPNLCHIK